MCSSTPYRWPIYSNDSIMEFSNREFSFMETSFPEIFCQGFFFHGKFFSWNFPFHEIKIFLGIFLIMENSFHGICFHSIFFLKFSFMKKKIMENSCSQKFYYTSIKQTFVDFKKVPKGIRYYRNEQHIKISAKFVDNQ